KLFSALFSYSLRSLKLAYFTTFCPFRQYRALKSSLLFYFFSRDDYLCLALMDNRGQRGLGSRMKRIRGDDVEFGAQILNGLKQAFIIFIIFELADQIIDFMKGPVMGDLFVP